MTTSEFIEELEKARTHFDWKLHPDTGWDADRRVTPRLHIRGRANLGPEAGIALFDPIGAVCYALSGEIHTEPSWRKAAETLGLLPISAAELSAAANDNTRVGAEGMREPVEHLQALRDHLIAALRLTPSSPPGSI